VLGGGGVTGVAWEIGVIEGLRRSGVDLSTADVIIGTSAGSVVGTRLSLGPISVAYEEQLEPGSDEIAAKLSATTLIKLAVLMARRTDEETKFKRIGKAARAAATGSPEERLAVIRSRIGDPGWPERDLRITAIDIDNGKFTVFDRTSGVTLLQAVSASCAVPLVWPPVSINSTTYVDGGARSPANADLAVGDQVLVIAPMPHGLTREHHLDKQLERSGVSRHLSITPDKESSTQMGSNSFDPAYRRPSAQAGLRQGVTAADEVAALWS